MENTSLKNLSRFSEEAEKRRKREEDQRAVQELIKSGKQILTVHWSEVYSDVQVRRKFKDIPEIADSLKRHGQENPIQVAPKTDKGYLIRRGERRWRGCKHNDSMVDIIIDDRALNDPIFELRLQLIENLQRDDLTPMEIAFGFQRLLEGEMTQKQIAEDMGMSESKVSKYLALIKCPPCVQELLEEEYTTDLELAGILRKINDIDPSRCEQMCATIVEDGMSRNFANGILRGLKQEKSDIDRADANPKGGNPKLDDPGSLAESEHQKDLEESGLNESGLELPPEPDPEPTKSSAKAPTAQDPHGKHEAALLNADGFYERRAEDAVLLCEVVHNGDTRKGVLQLHLLADEDDQVVVRIAGDMGEDELVAFKAMDVKLVGFKQ